MTNQKKTDYICTSKESEGPAPDTLDETLPPAGMIHFIYMVSVDFLSSGKKIALKG